MTAATPTTALAAYIPNNEDRGDLLWDPAAYAHAIGVATAISKSGLLPEHFKDKPASVLIALAMARRLREDPFVVLQSVHVIHGKPGFSAQYVIARANLSGVFRGPIRFEETGAGPTLAVTAWAELADSGERVEFEVSLQMAKDEGWTKNSKYQSMPKLMLRYRAATFLVRLYAPQVMLGMQTAEELRDVIDADDVDRRPVRILHDESTQAGVAPSTPPRGMAAVAAALGEETVAASTEAPTPTATTPPPAEQAVPKDTPRDFTADADVVWSQLGGKDWKAPVQAGETIKAKLGRKRMAPGQVKAIAEAGAAAGMWRFDAGWLHPVVGQAPTATTPEPSDEQALLGEITKLEEQLSDEQVAEAVRESGAPVLATDANLADVDHCSLDELDSYRKALRARAS